MKNSKEAIVDAYMKKAKSYAEAVESRYKDVGYVVSDSDEGIACSCCGISVQALFPVDGKLLCGFCSPIKDEIPPPDHPSWKQWEGHKCE